MKTIEQRQIRQMAAPVLLNYLLLTIFETLDKSIVGHYSVQGFAVIGIAETPIYEITGALGVLSSAFSMIAARLQGKKNTADFEHAFAVTRMVSWIIGLLFFLASCIGGRFFFRHLYKIEGDALDELLSYFYPASFTVLQNLLLFVYSAYYRNRLNTRISFYSTATATIVNLFFDASLVYGLFGLPQFGTAGAAWGSVIGLSAGLLVYQIPYYAFRRRQPISRNQIWLLLNKIFALYPSMLGQEFFEGTLFTLILSGIIARMGTQQMAVYSLLFTVENMIELPIYAYATASQTYALQNSAAGNLELAKRYLKLGRQSTGKVIAVLALLCFIFKTQVFYLILSDQTVIRDAGKLLAWVLGIAFIKIAYQFYMGYLQGVGKEKYIFACSLLSTTVSSIAAMIVGDHLQLPGIYLVLIGKYLILSILFASKTKALQHQVKT